MLHWKTKNRTSHFTPNETKTRNVNTHMELRVTIFGYNYQRLKVTTKIQRARKCLESSFICFVEFCNVTFPLDSLCWALFSDVFFISFGGGARELLFLSVATMTELFYRFTKTNIMCYTPNQPASSQFWWHFYYFSVFLLFFFLLSPTKCGQSKFSFMLC